MRKMLIIMENIYFFEKIKFSDGAKTLSTSSTFSTTLIINKLSIFLHNQQLSTFVNKMGIIFNFSTNCNIFNSRSIKLVS